MNPFVVGGIVEAVGKIADDLFTSDKERLDAQIEMQRIGIEAAQIEADLLQGQMSINQTEAQHSSVFVAGWRPAIGWVGVGAMAYQFVLYPFMVWLWALMQAKGWVPQELQAPPMLDTEALWVILSGMLGIAGMRSFEKVKKVSTQ